MKTNPTYNIPIPFITNGDISSLSPQQRQHYYNECCSKLGLDPKLRPFKILRVHGRELLYCDRGCVQYLNRLHHISHHILARETMNGCYVVTAQAISPGGYITESIGVASIRKLEGEQLCDAMMKAEARAKHRATLDLLGLGLFDESELFPLPLKGGIETPELPFHSSPYTPEDDEADTGIPISLFFSSKGLKNKITACHTPEELTTLYNNNKHRIDTEPRLRQLFTERKQELMGLVAA